MADPAAVANLGLTAGVASDLVIVQSDLKATQTVGKTCASDVVIVQSDVKTIEVYCEAASSDLVIVQSDVIVVNTKIGTPANTDIATDIARHANKTSAYGPPGFQDHFMNLANTADPDSTYWTVVEDNDAIVACIYSAEYIMLRVKAGTAATNDGVAHTLGKYHCGPSTRHSPTSATTKTNVEFTAVFSVTDLTGEAAIGLLSIVDSGSATADGVDGAVTFVGIHCDNDTERFITNVNGSVEATGLTLSDATPYHIKMVYNGTNWKFYLDGVLTATHATQVPAESSFILLAAKNTNSITTDLITTYVDIVHS